MHGLQCPLPNTATKPKSSSISKRRYIGDALRTAKGPGFDLTAPHGHGEVGDEGVFGLSGAMEITKRHPASRHSCTASTVSLTVPIWFSLISAALHV